MLIELSSLTQINAFGSRNTGERRIFENRLVRLFGSRPKADRSASDTSSAKVRTCIFSITLWRWALTVRSVQPSTRAICLFALPRMISSEHFTLAWRQCRDAMRERCPACSFRSWVVL